MSIPDWNGVVELYLAAKKFLSFALAIERDTLHVVIGVLLQLGVASLTRRGLAGWSPVLFVLVVALANEAADLFVERWPDSAQQYGESVKDLLVTLVLPLVLMVYARWRLVPPDTLAEPSKNQDRPSHIDKSEVSP